MVTTRTTLLLFKWWISLKELLATGVFSWVLLEKGIVDHAGYITLIPSAAFQQRDKMFGNDWILQQDSVQSHIHTHTHIYIYIYVYEKSQSWCNEHFPSFIDKDRCSPNSPDLNPVGYCVYNERRQVIDWHKITSGHTLMSALSRAVRQICPDFIYDSCASWTDRLYRTSQGHGNYLRKSKYQFV
jgi:hypothetical protein